MKLPPPHDIVMQTLPLHVGVAESVQSADAEHVVTTAAVVTTVFPVKGIVKDIAVGSSTGTVDMHVVSLVVIHVDVQPTLEWRLLFETHLLSAETWRHGPEFR